MIYPLFTERLSIQPLGMNDIEAFVKYRQDPEIARFQSWETSYSLADAVNLVQGQHQVTLASEGNWLQLAIHDLDTKLLIGDVALHSLDEKSSRFELGFTLAREHQGKGLGKEAVTRVISYLVDDEGATFFEASTDRRNVRSSKLLVSLGFELQPSRSWEEDFKNEWVTVDVYEASYPRLK